MYFSGVLTHHNPYVINFEIISEKVGNDDLDWFGKENQHNEQHHIRHQHRTCNPFRLEQRNRSLNMDEKILRLASKLSRYRKNSSLQQVSCVVHANE